MEDSGSEAVRMSRARRAAAAIAASLVDVDILAARHAPLFNFRSAFLMPVVGSY